MMLLLSQDMQRGVLVSQGGRRCCYGNTRPGGRNDQSENRNALCASTRRRLVRERGTPQNPFREMKVAEPIGVELLQAERLKDFFAFHHRLPATSECCIRPQLQNAVQKFIFEGRRAIAVATATKN
jgi:hypothetical protein